MSPNPLKIRVPAGSGPLPSISPGLERERRNADARAKVAERRARVSRRRGDLLRAGHARQEANQAAARVRQMAA